MGRPRLRFEKKCPKCGETYETVPSRPAKFCSSACYNAARSGVARGPYVERETKRCLVCDKPFTVGGYGNPRRATEFCSNLCQQRGRYRAGTPSKKLSAVQAAYVAGIIDGEGSVMLYRRRIGSVTLRVAVTNTCRELLDWLASATGVGAPHGHAKATDVRRETFMWHINGDAALSMLAQAVPFMTVKHRQAKLGIAFQRRLHTPKLKAEYQWQYEWMDRMRDMNRRGPRLKESHGE